MLYFAIFTHAYYADIHHNRVPFQEYLACGILCSFERLPTEQLPPLWLVYSNTPSDSGAVHSPVKQRWLAGDSDIRRDMALIASLAEQGRCATYLPCLSLHSSEA